jgi:hypothetical protein
MVAAKKRRAVRSKQARGAARRERTRRTPAVYKKIRLGSRATVARSLAKLRMASLDISAILDTAKGESLGKANQLAGGLVGKRKKVGEERDFIRNMTRWAAVQTSDAEERRRIVVRAFKQNHREIFAVHGCSGLSPTEAALFMRSYFAEGGSIQAVAEWLRIAGRRLQSVQPTPLEVVVGTALPVHRAPSRPQNGRTPTTAGFFDWVDDAADAVGDFFSDVGNAVGDAVSTVVNAVLNAGKSLFDAVAAAVNWTVDQVKDLVRALIAVGKSVAAILTEALKLGLGVVKKFVQALVAAGRTVGEILSWAVLKAADVVRDTVSALLAAGKSVYQLVFWASGAIAAVAQKVVRALLDAGRTVAQVMADIVRLASAAAKKMVAALYYASQKLGEIIASIANTAASVIRTVLEGLLAIGITLATTVATICTNVAAAFRKGLLEGLIALGKAPLEILKAALAAGGATLGLAFAALMEVFGGHRGLTVEEIAEARKVFGWSIDLSRVKIAVASIPADVVNWVNGQRPFTTMYVINFSSSAHITMGTLMHELTHVWQAVVAGPIYMVEALHSQFFGRGYEVTPADIAAANGDIRNLEREQQAVVVERYYLGKFGGGGHDPAMYEQLAKGVYKPGKFVTWPRDVVLPHMLPFRDRTIGRVPRLPLQGNY